MQVNDNSGVPYMKSLTNCLTRIIGDGYSEDFKIIDAGLVALQQNKIYIPAQIQIINFFRFEGASNSNDNAILYILETYDGVKGTLIDAYGIYKDSRIKSFINEINKIQKQIVKN